MNKRNIIINVIALMLVLLYGCGRDRNEQVAASSHSSLEHRSERLTTHEFIQWCADEAHELNKRKEISEVAYQLSYMPSESMAYLELRTGDYNDSLFKEACKHYTAMTYFNFKIALPEGSGELLKYKLNSPQQYERRVKYLAFGMQEDVFIVQQGDTVYPGLYHYERIYEVAPEATVLMAFDNKKFDPTKEFSVVYNDRLFDKGYIKFNYTDQQLMDVPNITGL